jgi:hypothetical protein
MDKIKAGDTRRGGAAGRRRPLKARRPAAGARSQRSDADTAAPGGMFDVQRKLWKTGLSVLSRGSQLASASGGASKLTESLQDGLKKLEEVFDQRVHDALRRIGIPTEQELRELRARLTELERAVQRLTPPRGRK